MTRGSKDPAVADRWWQIPSLIRTGCCRYPTPCVCMLRRKAIWRGKNPRDFRKDRRERRWFVLERPRRDTNGGSETEVTVTSKLPKIGSLQPLGCTAWVLQTQVCKSSFSGWTKCALLIQMGFSIKGMSRNIGSGSRARACSLSLSPSHTHSLSLSSIFQEQLGTASLRKPCARTSSPAPLLNPSARLELLAARSTPSS